MITPAVQRWRQHRSTYRPANEPIEPRRYEVAPLPEQDAKDFVRTHHYSSAYPAARYRFGLYGLFHSQPLVGVAVFSHPVNEAVFQGLPGQGLERVELGRLVLLDEVPSNAESWFVARCFESLRQAGIVGVVSDADPLRTEAADGTIVCRGHVGTVYSALNGVYKGQTGRTTRRLLPDGRVISSRAIQKIRAQEQGARYSAAILERFGAEPMTGNPVEWLHLWLPRLTRAVRHPGNHRYLFGLDPVARRYLPNGLPYPKMGDRELGRAA